VDLTGDVLPAGTVAADFEVFVTPDVNFGANPTPGVFVAYQAVNLAGATLTLQVRTAGPQALVDNAFTVEILLAAP
jgi:hypothetical protein